MKTKLDVGSPEYYFRKALEERFDSRQEAAAALDIPLHRLNLACRGDLSQVTGADWEKLCPILQPHLRADLAQRYFGIR